MIMRRLLSLVLALGLMIAADGAAAREKAPHLTILVSIDGFRADYLDRGDTPVMKALAENGARAAMRPSFPSVTFPNHYTLITGKRPDRHGIVANTMVDPSVSSEKFTMRSLDPAWWSQAKPFWVSVEQQGKRAAAMFWPGSEVEIDGVRPSRWVKFDQTMSGEARVDQVLAWLDSADGPPIAFSTLYFDIVDTQGHHYSPESPEVRAAAASVDAALGRLVAGLKARGRFESTDIVIVADHGMAPLPAANRVVLDDLVDVSKIQLVTTGAVTAFSPKPGERKAVEAAVLSKPLPHMTCWKKNRIPARFHYGRNLRVPAIVCLSETGWYTTTEAAKQKPSEWDGKDGGAHGFDPYDPTMQAVFVAHGPSFKSGVALPVFDNVDVYALLAKVTGVRPEKTDGSLKVVREALR
ncbi:ectonucleotide pyrophosphatase/phosphodiesterase [Caulobacter sp. SL161]|uniref:alkaline phosphatase family protein n=1 Tax=Caulobacter sp. SL161 TaxID=2995156 RepID=UPI002272AA13|nr:ectonucleotide pyrophosphatase/phosphodiesterase [Caulobacter sp. SL161]MCY1647271.1 ectonucleotide pyrophosphatase/phosphodiesterase [Caulobacter sp. SL161]